VSRESFVEDGSLADQPLLDCQPFVQRVAQLLRQPGVMEHWREQCQLSCQERRQRGEQHRAWEEERAAAFASEDPTPEPCGQAPPRQGLVRARTRVFPTDGSGRVGNDWMLVGVWVRPELGDGEEPYADGPLPFSSRHTLSLADCYFVLAVIHDTGRRHGLWINPWHLDRGHSGDGIEATTWAAQRSFVARLRAGDKLTLYDCVSRVDADLRNSGLTHVEPLPAPAKDDPAVESDAKQPGRPRLRCEPSDRSVWLDGKRLASGLPEDVFAYFSILAERYPESVSFPSMAKRSIPLKGVNQTRLKSRIPRALRSFVKTIPGKGHSLRLPP